MSKIEVYLNEKQVDSLKSILLQSERGFHVLFDRDMIAETFKMSFSEDDFFEVENLKQVQDQMLTLLQKKTLNDKKDYIRGLDKTSQHRLIRAYFYMIENNLRIQQKKPH